MSAPRRFNRDPLINLVQRLDSMPPGEPSADTVPTGFPSLDRALGGGLRRRDLVVLGGDVGSGKSALAVATALRTARAGHVVSYFSGEMDDERLFERALAIYGRTRVDDLRTADLTDATRAAVGAAALRLREVPIHVYPMTGANFHDLLAPAWEDKPAMVVLDYLQLLPPPEKRFTLEEDSAASLRALKAVALERQVVCLLVAQLPALPPERKDQRPTLDDFGSLGAIKQHADVALALYREEMYDPGADVSGATELSILKNRNGPTGFIDLYFHPEWLRFEDMLDPDES